jgi:phosphocarrier protein HPr
MKLPRPQMQATCHLVVGRSPVSRKFDRHPWHLIRVVSRLRCKLVVKKGPEEIDFQSIDWKSAPRFFKPGTKLAIYGEGQEAERGVNLLSLLLRDPPEGDSILKRFSRETTVQNRLGMHARPAAAFVSTAICFRSEIIVERDGEKVNGRSIMGLEMLAAGPGARITIHAVGDDAEEAVEALADLVERHRFEEE